MVSVASHTARAVASAAAHDFARARVRRHAIDVERVAVDEGVRQRIGDFFDVAAHQVCDDGGGGDLDKDGRIERGGRAVEMVALREHALDFIGLDHGRHDVAHQQRFAAGGKSLARQMIGDGENAAEIVRRMAAGPPGVAEIEPAHETGRVEGSLDRIKRISGARHFCAVRNHGARHDGAEQFRAFGCAKRFERATERVDQAITRVRVGFGIADLAAAGVLGEGDEFFVGRGTFRVGGVAHADILCG